MAQSDFWLQSNNGKIYQLGDLTNSRGGGAAKNSKIEKIIKLFDLDGNGKLDEQNSNGINEYDSIFKTIQKIAGDKVLSEDEFLSFINEKQKDVAEEERVTQDDLNEFFDYASSAYIRKTDKSVILYKNGVISQVKKANEKGEVETYSYRQTKSGDKSFFEISRMDSVGMTKFFVSEIDEDGEYNPENLMSKYIYRANKKTEVIVYSDGKIAEKGHLLGNNFVKELECMYSDSQVIVTSNIESGKERKFAESIDENGNLYNVSEIRTRNYDGTGRIDKLTDDGKKTTVILKHIDENFEYSEDDIEKEFTSLNVDNLDTYDIDGGVNSTLSNIYSHIANLENNLPVSELTYNHQILKNFFESLGTSESEYKKVGDNPPEYVISSTDSSNSEYTGQRIIVENDIDVLEGTSIRAVKSNKHYNVVLSDKDSQFSKIYSFDSRGNFLYATKINQAAPNVKIRIYPDGTKDEILSKDGLAVQSNKYNQKGQCTKITSYEWDEGKLLSKDTIYTEFNDGKEKDVRIITQNNGDTYYYKPDSKGEYTVFDSVKKCDSIPVLNDKNEIVGYNPISVITINNDGTIGQAGTYKRADMPHQLQSGEHYDFSSFDNDIRNTAADLLIQTYDNTISMLNDELKNNGRSIIDASVWLDMLTGLCDSQTYKNVKDAWTANGGVNAPKEVVRKIIGGALTNAITKLEEQKALALRLKKSCYVTEEIKDESGNIQRYLYRSDEYNPQDKDYQKYRIKDKDGNALTGDAIEKFLQANYDLDEGDFATKYEKLTGKSWNIEEHQKYTRYNLHIAKLQSNLQAIYDNYKANNGNLDEKFKILFANISGESAFNEQTLKGFIHQAEEYKDEEGKPIVAVMNTNVALTKQLEYSKTPLEKSKTNEIIRGIQNDRENVAQAGGILDVFSMIAGFKASEVILSKLWKGAKTFGNMMKTKRLAQYTANAAKWLESSGRTARTLNLTKSAITRMSVGGANFGFYDSVHEVGRQIYAGEDYNADKVVNKGFLGFGTGASAGFLSMVISEPILRALYKPQNEDVVVEVGKTLLKSDRSGKKLASVISQTKSMPTFATAPVLKSLGFGLEVFTFSVASGGIHLLDGEELRQSIKAARSSIPALQKYSEEDIENMSKSDIMRSMLDMQGFDTNDLNDAQVTALYGKEEYINQFKGLLQFKFSESIVKNTIGMLLTKGKAANGKFGPRVSAMNFEPAENGFYKLVGDKSGKTYTDSDVTAMVERAMSLDAIDSRIQNKYNKYQGKVISGSDFAKMTSMNMPEGLLDNVFVIPKGDRYQIISADGKTTDTNIEGFIEFSENLFKNFVEEHQKAGIEKFIQSHLDELNIPESDRDIQAAILRKTLYEKFGLIETETAPKKVHDESGVNEGVNGVNDETPSSTPTERVNKTRHNEVDKYDIDEAEMDEHTPEELKELWQIIISDVPKGGKITSNYGKDENSGYDFYYDANGNVTQKVYFSDRTGGKIKQVEKYEYNSTGKVIKEEHYDDGFLDSYNTYEYDSRGNRISLKRYNEAGNLVCHNETKYDINNNVTEFIDKSSKGHIINHRICEYDGNRLIKETRYSHGQLDGEIVYEPDGTKKEYDADRDILKITKPDGTVEFVEHYKNGEPTSVDYKPNIEQIKSKEDIADFYIKTLNYSENVRTDLSSMTEAETANFKKVLQLAAENHKGDEFDNIANMLFFGFEPNEFGILLKVLEEPSSKENLIDAQVNDRFEYLVSISNKNDALKNVITLMEYREQCQNPVLSNINNILYLAEKSKNIKALIERLNWQDKNGNYVINNKNVNSYNGIALIIARHYPQARNAEMLDIISKNTQTEYENHVVFYPSLDILQDIFDKKPDISPKELEVEFLSQQANNILESYKPDKSKYTDIKEYERDLRFYNYLADYIKGNKIENLLTFAEVMVSKNQLAVPAGEMAEMQKKQKIMLYDGNIDKVKNDILITLETVQDEHIIELVKKQLTELENNDISRSQKIIKYRYIQEIIDIYNNTTGVYTTLENSHQSLPYYKKFLQYIRQEEPSVTKEITQSYSKFEKKFKNFVKIFGVVLPDSVVKKYKDKYTQLCSDFQEELKIHTLREYCKVSNDELSDYMYQEVYLKNRNIPDKIKQQCIDIHQKYGVKVFVPADAPEDTRILDFVDKELQIWQETSGGKVKFPPTIDFLTAKEDYKGSTVGFCQSSESGAISLDGFNLNNTQFALRHEITHANDEDLNKPLPEGIVAQRKAETATGESTVVKDLDNCKYVEEFRRAGIPEWHIGYAYKNSAEFIAVAAEGDMSKYSQEFKDFLVKMGMPKWMLDMPKVVKEEFTHPTAPQLEPEGVNEGVNGVNIGAQNIPSQPVENGTPVQQNRARNFTSVCKQLDNEHVSYELFADNTGDNTVIKISVAGERPKLKDGTPDMRTGIPFTYTVYKFDKNGAIAEGFPKSNLSKQDVKEYEKGLQSYTVDNSEADNSGYLNISMSPAVPAKSTNHREKTQQRNIQIKIALRQHINRGEYVTNADLAQELGLKASDIQNARNIDSEIKNLLNALKPFRKGSTQRVIADKAASDKHETIEKPEVITEQPDAKEQKTLSEEEEFELALQSEKVEYINNELEVWDEMLKDEIIDFDILSFKLNEYNETDVKNSDFVLKLFNNNSNKLPYVVKLLDYLDACKTRDGLYDETKIDEYDKISHDDSMVENYKNWYRRIKDKVNLSADNYHMLVKVYNISPKYIVSGNSNILDTFGVNNYKDLVEFIENSVSYGRGNKLQLILKTFGQSDIDGLNNFLKEHNIKSFNIKQEVKKGQKEQVINLSFNSNKTGDLNTLLSEYKGIFERAFGEVTVSSSQEHWTFPNCKDVIDEIVQKSDMKYDPKSRKTVYGGYAKILNSLGIDYNNYKSKKLLGTKLLQLYNDLNDKSYINILQTLNDSAFGDTMPTIHSRLRFIERFILDNVDINDKNAVSDFIKGFYAHITESLKKGVIITMHREGDGHISPSVIVDGITIGLNNKTQISTVINNNSEPAPWIKRISLSSKDTNKNNQAVNREPALLAKNTSNPSQKTINEKPLILVGKVGKSQFDVKSAQPAERISQFEDYFKDVQANSNGNKVTVLSNGIIVTKTAQNEYIVEIPSSENSTGYERIFTYNQNGVLDESKVAVKNSDGTTTEQIISYDNGKECIKEETVLNGRFVIKKSFTDIQTGAQETTEFEYVKDNEAKMISTSNEPGELKNHPGSISCRRIHLTDNDRPVNQNRITVTEWIYPDGSKDSREITHDGYVIELTRDGKAVIEGKTVSLEQVRKKSDYEQFNSDITAQIQESKAVEYTGEIPRGYVIDEVSHKPIKVDVDKIDVKIDYQKGQGGSIVIKDEHGNQLGHVGFTIRKNSKQMHFHALGSLVEGCGIGTRLINELVKISEQEGMELVAEAGTYPGLGGAKHSPTNLKFYYKMGFRAVDPEVDKVVRECIEKGFDIPPSLNKNEKIKYVGTENSVQKQLEVLDISDNFLNDFKATGNNYEIIDTVDKNGNQIKLLRFHNNIVDGGNYNYAILTSDGKILQDGLHTDISDSDMQKVLDNYGVKIDELEFTKVKGKARTELSSQTGMSIDFGISKTIVRAVGNLIQKYKSAKLTEKVKQGVNEGVGVNHGKEASRPTAPLDEKGAGVNHGKEASRPTAPLDEKGVGVNEGVSEVNAQIRSDRKTQTPEEVDALLRKWLNYNGYKIACKKELFNNIKNLDYENIAEHLKNIKLMIDLDLNLSNAIVRQGYFYSKEGLEAFNWFKEHLSSKQLERNSFSDLNYVLIYFDARLFKTAMKRGLLNDINKLRNDLSDIIRLAKMSDAEYESNISAAKNALQNAGGDYEALKLKAIEGFKEIGYQRNIKYKTKYITEENVVAINQMIDAIKSTGLNFAHTSIDETITNTTLQNVTARIEMLKTLAKSGDYKRSEIAGIVRTINEHNLELAKELLKDKDIPLDIICRTLNSENIQKGNFDLQTIINNVQNYPRVKDIKALKALDNLQPTNTNPTKLDPRNIESSSLVFVHMTNYPVKNGKIMSPREESGTIRNTVHFTLNHAVTSHIAGNWDEMKYAIIMPYESTVKANNSGKFIEGMPNDTYSSGSVTLPESAVILVHNPNLKAGELKVQDSPDMQGVKIIETSTAPHDLVPTVIEKMGYTHMQADTGLGTFDYGNFDGVSANDSFANYNAWADFCKTQGIRPMKHTPSPISKASYIIETIGLISTCGSWKHAGVNYKNILLKNIEKIKDEVKQGYVIDLDIDRLYDIIKTSSTPDSALAEIENQMSIHPTNQHEKTPGKLKYTGTSALIKGLDYSSYEKYLNMLNDPKKLMDYIKGSSGVKDIPDPPDVLVSEKSKPQIKDDKTNTSQPFNAQIRSDRKTQTLEAEVKETPAEHTAAQKTVAKQEETTVQETVEQKNQTSVIEARKANIHKLIANNSSFKDEYKTLIDEMVSDPEKSEVFAEVITNLINNSGNLGNYQGFYINKVLEAATRFSGNTAQVQINLLRDISKSPKLSEILLKTTDGQDSVFKYRETAMLMNTLAHSPYAKYFDADGIVEVIRRHYKAEKDSYERKHLDDWSPVNAINNILSAVKESEYVGKNEALMKKLPELLSKFGNFKNAKYNTNNILYMLEKCPRLLENPLFIENIDQLLFIKDSKDIVGLQYIPNEILSNPELMQSHDFLRNMCSLGKLFKDKSDQAKDIVNKITSNPVFYDNKFLLQDIAKTLSEAEKPLDEIQENLNYAEKILNLNNESINKNRKLWIPVDSEHKKMIDLYLSDPKYAQNPNISSRIGQLENVKQLQNLITFFNTRFSDGNIQEVPAVRTLLQNPIVKNKKEFSNVLSDFEQKMSMVKDKTVLDFVNSRLNELAHNQNLTEKALTELYELYNILDVVNEYNGFYSSYLKHKESKVNDNNTSHYNEEVQKHSSESTGRSFFHDGKKSRMSEEYNENKQYSETVENRVTKNSSLASENRIGSMREYLINYPDSKLADHFYKYYYITLLKEHNIPESVINKCQSFEKKYGIRMLIPMNFESKDLIDLCGATEKLLEEFYIASNGKAYYPPVLDYRSIGDWGGLFEGAAGLAGDTQVGINTKDSYNFRLKKTMETLRHELVHFNDELKDGKKIPDMSKVDEVMPRIKDENGKTKEIDYDNCKYMDILREAGIEEYHVKYAYENVFEFKAVAMTGNVQVYNKPEYAEFKQFLIDIGTPEWMFNLDAPHVKDKTNSQDSLDGFVINPDAKGVNEGVKGGKKVSPQAVSSRQDNSGLGFDVKKSGSTSTKPDGINADMSLNQAKVENTVIIKDNSGCLSLTDEAGNTLGSVQYAIKGDDNNKVLNFEGLKADVQGQGVGTKLILELINTSTRLGAKGRLSATASPMLARNGKVTNIEFYYKLGFRAVDPKKDKAIRSYIEQGKEVPVALNVGTEIELTKNTAAGLIRNIRTDILDKHKIISSKLGKDVDKSISDLAGMMKNAEPQEIQIKIDSIKNSINELSKTNPEEAENLTLVLNAYTVPKIGAEATREEIGAVVQHLRRQYQLQHSEIERELKSILPQKYTDDKVFSSRIKSDMSLFDKIENYAIENPEEPFLNALKGVRDTAGFRIKLPSVEINNILSDKALSKGQDISKIFSEGLKEYSKDIIGIINNIIYTKNPYFHIERLSDYKDKDGNALVSETDLWQIREDAALNGKPITIESLRFTSQKSGYPALQINLRTPDGKIIELQIRFDEVHEYAEFEHLVYDIMSNKDIIGRHPELEPLLQPLSDVLDSMSEEQYEQYYIPYTRAQYNYRFMKAFGIETKEPRLADFPGPDGKPLSPLLDAKNLMKLHDLMDEVKDEKNPKPVEQALKEYSMAVEKS